MHKADSVESSWVAQRVMHKEKSKVQILKSLTYMRFMGIVQLTRKFLEDTPLAEGMGSCRSFPKVSQISICDSSFEFIIFWRILLEWSGMYLYIDCIDCIYWSTHGNDKESFFIYIVSSVFCMDETLKSVVSL